MIWPYDHLHTVKQRNIHVKESLCIKKKINKSTYMYIYSNIQQLQNNMHVCVFAVHTVIVLHLHFNTYMYIFVVYEMKI